MEATMARTLTPSLEEEYRDLFGGMQIREERKDDVAAIYSRIKGANALPKYVKVEQSTGVPWFFVAILHNLESSGRFDRHLHNGDPLSRPTVQVPAGRPPNATFPCSWDVSAADALQLKHFSAQSRWDLPGIAFALETNNGFGYRDNHPHVKSPYLWSFSN